MTTHTTLLGVASLLKRIDRNTSDAALRKHWGDVTPAYQAHPDVIKAFQTKAKEFQK